MLRKLYWRIRLASLGYVKVGDFGNVVYGLNSKGDYCFWRSSGLSLCVLKKCTSRVEAEMFYNVFIKGVFLENEN